MNISSASDYAIRALLVLAKNFSEDPQLLTTAEEIGESQKIPGKYLEAIIRKLRHAGLIESHRGPQGGHRLALNPSQISLADAIRAVDGPLAAVRGERPESVSYKGDATKLNLVWIAVRVALRDVLEEVSIQQVLSGNLSAKIRRLIDQPGAWDRRKLQ